MEKLTYASCSKCLKLNKVDLDRAREMPPKCGACGTSLDVHGAVVSANSLQLKKLIEKSPLPVIVDFWAPWCAPCRSFAPTFETVAREKSGAAVFVKVNTEEDPRASQTYGVQGIPTVAAFRAGQEKDRQSGALPADSFRQWVQRI